MSVNIGLFGLGRPSQNGPPEFHPSKSSLSLDLTQQTSHHQQQPQQHQKPLAQPVHSHNSIGYHDPPFEQPSSRQHLISSTPAAAPGATQAKNMWGSPFTLPSLSVPLFSGGGGNPTSSSSATTRQKPFVQQSFPEITEDESGGQISTQHQSHLYGQTQLQPSHSYQQPHSHQQQAPEYSRIHLQQHTQPQQQFSLTSPHPPSDNDSSRDLSSIDVHKLEISQLENLYGQMRSRISSKRQILHRLQHDIASDEMFLSKIHQVLSKSLGLDFASNSRPLTPSSNAFAFNSSSTSLSAYDNNNIIPTNLAHDINIHHNNLPIDSVASRLHDEKMEKISAFESGGEGISAGKHSSELVCRKWNRGDCFKGPRCNYYHECINCGGPHIRSKCVSTSLAASESGIHSPSVVDDDGDTNSVSDEVCIKWNHKECLWGDMCHRKHMCLNCRNAHRVTECPMYAKFGSNFDDSICMNWNEGRCRMRERCKREHKCSICGSMEHAAVKCDFDGGSADANDDSRIKLEETCLNWNSCRCNMSKYQCKRLHQCSVCNSPEHMAIACTNAQSPEDLFQAGIDICHNWNVGGCDDTVYPSGNSNVVIGSNCKRLHCCATCKKIEHASTQCELLSHYPHRPKLQEICMNWNEGRCRMGDRCKREHKCSSCGSDDHPGVKCELENLINKTSIQDSN